MASTLGIGVDIAVAALTFAYIGKLLFQSFMISALDTSSLSSFDFDGGKESLGRQSVGRKIRL